MTWKKRNENKSGKSGSDVHSSDWLGGHLLLIKCERWWKAGRIWSRGWYQIHVEGLQPTGKFHPAMLCFVTVLQMQQQIYALGNLKDKVLFHVVKWGPKGSFHLLLGLKHACVLLHLVQTRSTGTNASQRHSAEVCRAGNRCEFETVLLHILESFHNYCWWILPVIMWHFASVIKKISLQPRPWCIVLLWAPHLLQGCHTDTSQPPAQPLKPQLATVWNLTPNQRRSSKTALALNCEGGKQT